MIRSYNIHKLTNSYLMKPNMFHSLYSKPNELSIIHKQDMHTYTRFSRNYLPPNKSVIIKKKHKYLPLKIFIGSVVTFAGGRYIYCVQNRGNDI